MPDSIKNLSVFAVCIAVVLVGYYLLSDTLSPSVIDGGDAERAQLMDKTQAFIVRSSQLSQVAIDQNFFVDPVFASLQSYATDIPEQPIGRNDIFSNPRSVDSVIAASAE
jgi:hypothetical protein